MSKLATLVVSVAVLGGCLDHEGLAIEVNEPGHVAGRFSRDDVAVDFDIQREGDRYAMEFRAAEGAHLITTTLEGSFQSTRVLDGQLVFSGIVNEPEPAARGYRAAGHFYFIGGIAPQVWVARSQISDMPVHGFASQDLSQSTFDGTDRLTASQLQPQTSRSLQPCTS